MRTLVSQVTGCSCPVYTCAPPSLFVTNLARRRSCFWQRRQMLFYNGLSCSTTSTETTTQKWETLKLMTLSPSSQLPITGQSLSPHVLPILENLGTQQRSQGSIPNKVSEFLQIIHSYLNLLQVLPPSDTHTRICRWTDR